MMLARYVLFSIVITSLALFVVFIFPLNIPIEQSDDFSESPYLEEMEALERRMPLHPDDYQKLRELREKHNKYYEELIKKIHEEGEKTLVRDEKQQWLKKSMMLLPLTILIWGLAFYYFYKKYRYQHYYSVLLLPVILVFSPVLALFNLVIITVVIMGIAFWCDLKQTE